MAKKSIVLSLTAKHFKDRKYGNPFDCPISAAAKDLFGTKDVCECIRYIEINGNRYYHEFYGSDQFHRDKQIARAVNFSSKSLIRGIVLTKN